MSSQQNQQKTAAEIAEEQRKKAAAKKADETRVAANTAASSGGFLEMVSDFLNYIFSIVFGKNGEEEPEIGEDAGDPNAKSLTIGEKASIGRNLVANGMAQKWHNYKEQHKGEKVSLHSPVEGSAKVTSPFGHRKAPKAGASTNHQGVDLVAPNESDKILAAEDGIVLYADRAGKSGITLTIGHADGSTTVYRHLKSLTELPKLGTEVAQGEIVGTMGNTGNSTGKHLHFEHRDANGVAHNPHIAGIGTLAKGASVRSGGATGDARYAGLVNKDVHPKLAVSSSVVVGSGTLPKAKTQNQRS